MHTHIHIIYTFFVSVFSQDVSCDASGTLDSGALEPITTPFSEYPGDGQTELGPLCPANLHSHIGAEHRSSGQGDASYTDNFDFENYSNGPEYESVNFPVQNQERYSGKRCNYYKNSKQGLPDSLDFAKDFKNYDFKYCVDFKVGTF